MSVACWHHPERELSSQRIPASVIPGLRFLLFSLQADEEVANDLNGASDIDLTNMKPSSGSNGANSSSNRRNQPMDMNMYATRKTIAQGKNRTVLKGSIIAN